MFNTISIIGCIVIVIILISILVIRRYKNNKIKMTTIFPNIPNKKIKNRINTI